MTPEEVRQAVESLLEKTGYQINVDIVDMRSGLVLTELMARQWGYVPVLQVIKRPDAPPVPDINHGR